MKKLLLISSLLLLSNPVLADTQCLNADNLELDGKIIYDKGKPYTGCIHSVADDGKVKWRGQVKNGKNEGEFPAYNEKGVMISNLIFKDGKPKTFKRYNENAQLDSEFTFPTEEAKGHSYYKIYYPNGNLMETGSNNAKDQQDGVVKFYYEDGKLEAETTYKDGVGDGPYKTYYPNGQIHTVGTNKNGIPDGEVIVYYDNGVLKKKAIFKDGEIVYPTRQVQFNGQTETAIVVSSVQDEYEYLHQEYPGFQLKQQALLKSDPVMDLMEIETADGETKTFYFDISSFFGTESEAMAAQEVMNQRTKKEQDNK